jgi:FkbM family methyltransferase
MGTDFNNFDGKHKSKQSALMKQKLHRFLNSILIKFGFELLTYPSGLLKRRIELMKKFNINFVFDVGANTGQYANQLRSAGYKGTIHSFEPLTEAFSILQKHTEEDKNWRAEQIGLGNFDGESVINVAENSVSSSILNIKKEHVEAVPESKYVAQEKITIRKLDSIFEKYEQLEKNFFLKIDTQGFEREVINGALLSLPKITGIQVEMSLVELYEGESMYEDLKRLVESYGFDLYSLEPGFSDPETRKLMQIDGIFFRSK